jgi:hypothetical protein
VAIISINNNIVASSNMAPLVHVAGRCQLFMDSCRIEQSNRVSEITLKSRGILEQVNGCWTMRHCYFLIPEGMTMHLPRDLERFIDPASIWHHVELRRPHWNLQAALLAQRIPRPR